MWKCFQPGEDPTVGDRIFETLVFVNFSAQDASILKISVPIIKRRSWGFQNTPNLQSLDDFEPSYCNWKKIKVFQNWFDIWFWKAVCEPLCFWLFYQSNFVQTLQVGGVLESSGSPLDDGHWDFDNCSKIGWDNWSWNGHFQHRNHFSVFLSLFKWGLPTSTSIFSAISASIFKISVPIIKRRSWGFQNTPNLQSLNEFWLRKQQKTVWPSKSINQTNFWQFLFFFKLP